MSTYQRLNNNQKSYNAFQAEKNDIFPLTKASKIFANHYNVTIDHAVQFLKEIGPCEWHHTGKFANVTNYYDVSVKTLEELKDEFNDFVYSPLKEKKIKINLFKCWNTDKEYRFWDWKITNRQGNNTFELTKIKKIVLKDLKDNLNKRFVRHKTTKRVLRENIKAQIKILKAINKEEIES